MRWHWVVVTTLTVAGSAQTVPLRLFGTVITVEGRVNGKGPFYFVVDTGAESCSLLPRVWEEAGVRAGYRVELVSSAGGSELVAASRNLRFEVGGAVAEGVEALAHTLPAIQAAVPEGVDGVLGQSFLARFDYVIDYRARKLSFGASLEGSRLPLRSTNGRPVVRVRSGRKTLELVLDSGASNLVLRRTRERMEAEAATAFLRGNTGGRMVWRGRTGRLTAGGVVLRDLETAYLAAGGGSEWDGLLPTALFGRVYFNNRENYVVVAP